jgi:hypothetical protein
MDVSINFQEVETCLKNTKIGKAPGYDGITVEHLQTSHTAIIQLLTVLFNLCLTIGYVPIAFTKGILIPLLKGNNFDRTKVES